MSGRFARHHSVRATSLSDIPADSETGSAGPQTHGQTVMQPQRNADLLRNGGTHTRNGAGRLRNVAGRRLRRQGFDNTIISSTAALEIRVTGDGGRAPARARRHRR